MMGIEGRLIHLQSAGVSVVLDTRGGGVPALLHWGADLGDLHADELAALEFGARAPLRDSRIDVPSRVGVLPTPAEGWIGLPGLVGSRGGAHFSPLFELVAESATQGPEGTARAWRCRARDEVAELDLQIDVELASSGLLRVAAELTNSAEVPYDLEGVTLALPVPAGADELFDLTGRFSRERVPQRGPFPIGRHVRESRQGMPGLDGPYVLVAGEPRFGFTRGEVWGIHCGWSGNQVVYAERTYNGHRHLGGGEVLLPGETRLAQGDRYRTPWLYGSYGRGLNQLAERFHRFLRSRNTHPAVPRPVVVNTWEAVYFEHDPNALLALAEAAADVGAERFVLDDGWFRHRRNPTAGLGDWYVDERIWPGGLHPLIDKVQGLGMDFGLWVEPEMVNLDSDLARAHPDWIFRAGGRQGIPVRNQYALDLGRPEAYRYVADRLRDLLETYEIAFLKWDHNRMLVEAGSGPRGVPGVHVQIQQVYRLLDELRAAHPGLEIETCASGGGRIDLGILEHTDRVWPSDCIDALERQQIHRYTQLLVPPEMIGTHIGGPEAHSTRRQQHLDFRAGTAFWGSMGIEWDIANASVAERDRLRRWVTAHKALRPLLHTGTVVVADHPDPAVWVSGVVSADRDEAVFGVATVDRSTTWPPGRLRLPGLDPDQRYRVEPLPPGDRYAIATQLPEWWDGGLTLSGRVLGEVGVQLPAMFPESIHLLRLSGVPGRSDSP